jgi:hypothetical protein
MSKNVPQTGRPGFDEFLKLARRSADFSTVRNRAKCPLVMRRDARQASPVIRWYFGVPEKRLRFWDRDE